MLTRECQHGFEANTSFEMPMQIDKRKPAINHGRLGPAMCREQENITPGLHTAKTLDARARAWGMRGE